MSYAVSQSGIFLFTNRQNRRFQKLRHKTLINTGLFVLCALALFSADAGAQQAPEENSHVLKPTPKTVAWGYYAATTPPALRIKSGDVLEVRIQSIKLAIPYAYTAFRPGSGFLPEDFKEPKMKIIPLDEKRMVGLFGNGIEIPLRPFFGSMGVAPPEASGRISSGPPGIHAGNLDNKELVAGTTLFIPIHVRGALFQIGDGHAGQGNGEVCITALETSLIGKLQFIVRKDMKLRWPRAETPVAFMTMGINEDLTEATRIAAREMIDFLVTEKKLSRDDAYMLSSVAADFSVTQLVDGTKGVHVMIPKAIFRTGAAR